MTSAPRWTAPALPSCLALLAACSGAGSSAGRTDAGSAAAPYLGQPRPGATPVPFAPGLVGTDAIELNSVFTPDGGEFFFTRVVNEVFTIFHSVRGAGGWSAPRPLPVYPDGDRALAVDMAVSPDGTELFFLGEYPHAHASAAPGYDLWLSRRVDGAWTTAEVVPPPVRTAADEIYATVVADGSLYFSSNRHDTSGPSDLYRAQRLPGGRFAEPVRVGPPLTHPSGVGDTYVAPDESLLVLSSRRAPGHGNGDLFVSFRRPDGSWSEPANLGATINTAAHEFCPMMSPDGQYLFFSRRYGDTWETTTDGDVFWVEAGVLERLSPADSWGPRADGAR